MSNTGTATLKRRLRTQMDAHGLRRTPGDPLGQSWRVNDNRIYSLDFTVWTDPERPGTTMATFEAAFDLRDLYVWREVGVNETAGLLLDSPSCLWNATRVPLGRVPHSHFEIGTAGDVDEVSQGLKEWLGYLEGLPETWKPWYGHSRQIGEYAGKVPLGAFPRICALTAMALSEGGYEDVRFCLDRVLQLLVSGLSPTLAGGLLSKSIQVEPKLARHLPSYALALANEQDSLGEANRRFADQSRKRRGV